MYSPLKSVSADLALIDSGSSSSASDSVTEGLSSCSKDESSDRVITFSFLTGASGDYCALAEERLLSGVLGSGSSKTTSLKFVRPSFRDNFIYSHVLFLRSELRCLLSERTIFSPKSNVSSSN